MPAASCSAISTGVAGSAPLLAVSRPFGSPQPVAVVCWWCERGNRAVREHPAHVR